MKRPVLLGILAAVIVTGLSLLDSLRAAGTFDLLGFLIDFAETALLVGAIAMGALAAMEVRDMRKERRSLVEDLAAARRDGERWRQSAQAHLSGLSRAIEQQFQDWDLTESEADVAGFLLKGLSHREIAELRQCSEATVRQHATVVYRKSRMASRAQLTAYFLEDLLSGAQESDAHTATAKIVLLNPKG